MTKDEGTKERMRHLEKEIADVKEQSRELEVRWKNEKETIEQIKEMQTSLERKRHEGEEAESKADFTHAAEIRYKEIPQIEGKFKKAQMRLKRLQKNRKILREEVTEEDIAQVIARWTGVPATRMLESEVKKLTRMEAELKKQIIGQDESIDKIAAAIKRARAGIANPNRPVGSFLFLGPTGVGKTELAKQLARYMFDDEKALVRFDMSEYMERHTVSKMLGAPPGYVGYEEAGKLTEAVRHRPYSIVLFDEIEKAHPDVFNVLLQVLDDGRLTDSKGRIVNFKNTVVILTSNVGSETLINMNQIGFEDAMKKSEAKSKQYDEVRNRVMEKLEKSFRPEFLNRLDEVIVFKPLSPTDIRKVVALQVDEAVQRLADREITITIDRRVYEKIGKEGYHAEYGARPLNRKIQTDLLNPLANAIIEGDLGKGSEVHIRIENGEYVFDTTKKQPRKAKAKKREEVLV